MSFDDLLARLRRAAQNGTHDTAALNEIRTLNRGQVNDEEFRLGVCDVLAALSQIDDEIEQLGAAVTL